MQITSAVIGPHTVVSLFGDLDYAVANELRAELFDAADSGTLSLVVDLTGVTFMDSAALGTLVGAKRRLTHREARLAVVCTNDTLRRIFRITALDTIIPLFPSLADATS